MNFTELINEYFNLLKCTQTEFSTYCNLSPSVISRYLSGERVPSDNNQISALAKGISELAANNGMDFNSYSYEHILDELNNSVHNKDKIYSVVSTNFDAIISYFNINVKNLASKTNFDSSFLYRVRSGERRPADLDGFCEIISEYVSSTYFESVDKETTKSFLECNDASFDDTTSFKLAINFYLQNHHNTNTNDSSANQMDGFLNALNDFDLDEFMDSIHFYDLKIPTSPIKIPVSKTYNTLEEMRQSELDFFKYTALSRSKEPIYMCGDMPMIEMAEDKEFNKKWMFGIAAAIKKGLHINIIHNVNRPFEELMLGFQAWIPIYMTGQVSPYQLEGYKNEVFHELNYVSGSASLYGECIDGYHNDGRYCLSSSKSEIKYYKKKLDNIFSHAVPLMDIYDSSRKNELYDFFNQSVQEKVTRRVMNYALPLFTMPKDLLLEMIRSVPENDKTSITTYYDKYSEQISSLVESCEYILDLHTMSEDEFNEKGMQLSFPILFMDYEIPYTYEQYKKHIDATIEYSKSHKHFQINYIDVSAFKNIRVTTLFGKYCVISKCKSPNIHFVLSHHEMVKAMENFKIAQID